MPQGKEKDSDIWGPLQSRPRHNQSPVNSIRTKEDFVKAQESGKTNNPSELLQENLFNIQQNPEKITETHNQQTGETIPLKT